MCLFCTVPIHISHIIFNISKFPKASSTDMHIYLVLHMYVYSAFTFYKSQGTLNLLSTVATTKTSVMCLQLWKSFPTIAVPLASPFELHKHFAMLSYQWTFFLYFRTLYGARNNKTVWYCSWYLLRYPSTLLDKPFFTSTLLHLCLNVIFVARESPQFGVMCNISSL